MTKKRKYKPLNKPYPSGSKQPGAGVSLPGSAPGKQPNLYGYHIDIPDAVYQRFQDIDDQLNTEDIPHEDLTGQKELPPGKQ